MDVFEAAESLIDKGLVMFIRKGLTGANLMSSKLGTIKTFEEYTKALTMACRSASISSSYAHGMSTTTLCQLAEEDESLHRHRPRRNCPTTQGRCPCHRCM